MTDDTFRFSVPVEIRWRDLDALNHVNNAVYFTYLEQARIGYLQELGLLPDTPSGMGFILAEAHCQFKSPLTLGERVTVHIRVSEVRRSSFVFEYRIHGGDGRLAAEARTAQVCYDYDAESAVPLPDAWRGLIIDFEPALSS